MSENIEHTTQTDKPTLKRYFLAIRKPIVVSTAISAVCTFLPISVIVTLRINSWVPTIISMVAVAICLVWAGKKSYRNFKPSIAQASFAGPVLIFFAYFIVDFISKIPYMFEPWESLEKHSGTLLGNPFFISLISIFSGYLLFFPIAMGLSAIGATLEKRKPSNTYQAPGCQGVEISAHEKD